MDAVTVNPQDGEAVNMVTRMDALFLVDRDARQKVMSSAELLAHRNALARPWVDEIRHVCRSLSKETLPKSALGKAVTYTLNQRPKLVGCLEYDEIELSNNLAENSMQPVALGRKNWLHVGSVKAGPKVAAILSVVESCRRIGVSVREYLAAVLPGLDRRTLSQVASLTPARWSAARG